MALELQRLLDVVNGPDQRLDLAEAALLIAAGEYPALDVSAYLAGLRESAARIQHRLPPAAGRGDTIFALNEHLFQEEGYTGAQRDYYDPQNSYLNRVIERRRGVPLSLAVVYVSVGRCLGLPLEVLPFPGHCLVRCLGGGDRVIILDPFSGGTQLFEEDLEALLLDVYGEDVPSAVTREMLAPADKSEVIMRMLRNLRNAYVRQERLDKALWTTHHIVQVAPERAREWRERARLYERLDYGPGAAADYRRYLQLAPEADDGEEIRMRLQTLRNRGLVLH
jgi:regulator of sirC expression with transglutaminase-like and TPR domain